MNIKNFKKFAKKPCNFQSMEKGAEKLGISVEKFQDDMVKAGYKCPDID